MDTTNPKLQVVIVPSPGMGHLIPLVEFAKLLHNSHQFSINLLIPTSSPPTLAQTTFLSTLPSSISSTFLPPVDPTLLPLNITHEETIFLTHFHSLSSFRSALRSLSSVVAVVTDLFGVDYFDVARELNLPPYLYYTSNAFSLLSFIHLPTLHENVTCEYRDMKDPWVLPGCVPLHGKDFADPTQDRTSECYKVFMYMIKKYNMIEGIFVNSFFDLEPGAFNALINDENRLSEIYPIGPVIQPVLDEDHGSECSSWLDEQPTNSVLFVSFGSGGTLSYDQTIELAMGLKKSGQRFIWVVRSPSNSPFGSMFSQGNKDDGSFQFLPEGYLDKIKDRGFLIPSWAPQIKILSHRSTGGFVSHCGWNSTLESIVFGVPLIAWPLYAEQRMNAVMLNEGLKVALRPKANERGVVERDEIARVVKDLMEGEEGNKTRDKTKVLSELAKKAMSEDGDSTKTLNQVIKKWSNSQ